MLARRKSTVTLENVGEQENTQAPYSKGRLFFTSERHHVCDFSDVVGQFSGQGLQYLAPFRQQMNLHLTAIHSTGPALHQTRFLAT